MEMILISNTVRFNQSFEDFTKNFKNKYSTFDVEDMSIVPKSTLSRINTENFKDEPLSKEESEEMKFTLENIIKELLVPRELYKKGEGVYTITFLAEEIELDPRPTGHNDSDHLIWKLYNLIELIDSCLIEDKPVYLSITDDNN